MDSALVESRRWAVIEAWAETFGAQRQEEDGRVGFTFPPYGGRFPDDPGLKRIVRILPMDDILEAVEITAARFHSPSTRACAYFFGVCWNMIGRQDAARDFASP